MRFAIGLFLYCKIALAQAPPSPPTPEDLAQGERLFQAQCGYCHGPRGDGGRGATLARPRLRHAQDEQSLFNVITRGIPGTQMPRSALSARQAWQVVAFVRSLGRVPKSELPGDSSRGAAVYTRQACAGCHTVSGRGGATGPDLTDIGARASAAFIRSSLLDPEAGVPDGFLLVRAVHKDGRTITGVRCNEDSFSIQLRDISGEFHSFWKDELQGLHKEWGKSPMPGYRDRLSPSDLDDLVAYLVSLEGSP
jgi:putative heme-binding domain-containing protein